MRKSDHEHLYRCITVLHTSYTKSKSPVFAVSAYSTVFRALSTSFTKLQMFETANKVTPRIDVSVTEIPSLKCASMLCRNFFASQFLDCVFGSADVVREKVRDNFFGLGKGGGGREWGGRTNHPKQPYKLFAKRLARCEG
jgi:hypothetical protein